MAIDLINDVLADPEYRYAKWAQKMGFIAAYMALPPRLWLDG